MLVEEGGENNATSIRGVVLVLRGGSTYHEHMLLRSQCLQCVSTIKCEKGARLGLCGKSTLANVSESQGWCCVVLCCVGVVFKNIYVKHTHNKTQTRFVRIARRELLSRIVNVLNITTLEISDFIRFRCKYENQTSQNV